MLKITFYTLAIMKDGKIGNLKQGGGIAYTEKGISEAESALTETLKVKNLKPVIEKIEVIKGFLT